MSLAFVLDHRADVDPDGEVIADESQSLTNDELLHRVRAASRHLRDLGVRPGDVVALKPANRIEFVVLLFAAWRLGAAVTPINPSLTAGDVDRQLDDAGARLLVTEDGPTERTSVTTLAVDTLNQCLGWGDLPASPDPSALALLIYTSRTTAGPEGERLDHAKVDAMAAVERDALELGAGDRCPLNLPLFHINSIVVSVLAPLLAGASIVIADRFDLKNAIGKIDERELRAARELSNGSNR